MIAATPAPAVAPAGGPDWATILTAIATLAAVAAAVWVALWTDRRSERRLSDERARSDRQLAEQRAHGSAQLDEERRLALEREQYAEAYTVQVGFGDRGIDTDGQPLDGDRDRFGNLAQTEVRQLAVMVVNRGSFTITRIEVQFCLGNSMIPHHRFQRTSGFEQVPEGLRAGYQAAREPSMSRVLTPFDAGLLFETDRIHERHLSGPYPVVRWTDRWGTRWEHKRGSVRRISDTEPWEP